MRFKTRTAVVGKRARAPRYVYYFGDGHADGAGSMKPLLGGKGANLHEMTRIGLPVPPGFTITTEVCSYFYDHNRTYPRELESQVAELSRAQADRRRGITIVAFSGEMDKLMTAFMLATGAAAMGMTVSMFFTFWALAAVRRGSSGRGNRFIDRLLATMLPSGPGRLGLSRWNMLGLGRPFFNLVLRKRHVETLGSLVLLARELGVRMVACQTAMEVMGLTRAEILEGIEFGGVATCLDAAQSSGSTLLI